MASGRRRMNPGEVGRRKVRFPMAVEADSWEDSKKAKNTKPFENDSSILVFSRGLERAGRIRGLGI